MGGGQIATAAALCARYGLAVRYVGLLPDLFREGQGVVADCELGADGVLALSFPLVPPGKGPGKSRISELVLPVEAGLPVQVVQGARDPFGTPDDVREALRAALGDKAAEVRVDEAKGTHSFTGGGAVADLVVAGLR